MVSVEETARALAGVWRIALFDRAGVNGFGRDYGACARSFWAYLFALPATLLLIAVSVAGQRPADPVLLGLADIIRDIIGAAGFPLLLLPLLRSFGRAERWAWFVTSYNWFNMAQVVASATLFCLVVGLPNINLANLILDSAQIYFFVLEAFLADAVLEIGAWRAVIVVLLDFGLGEVVDLVARWIGGTS
jgi:hypothetical protein